MNYDEFLLLVMVSDFIDETGGYIRLSEKEFDAGKQTNPGLEKDARTFLEYGEKCDGYWTGEKFMNQMAKAPLIAEVKYPRALCGSLTTANAMLLLLMMH